MERMTHRIHEALIPHRYRENRFVASMTLKNRCKICCTVRVFPGSEDWMFRIQAEMAAVAMEATVRLYRR
jgi:hypothetical protein